MIILSSTSAMWPIALNFRAYSTFFVQWSGISSQVHLRHWLKWLVMFYPRPATDCQFHSLFYFFCKTLFDQMSVLSPIPPLWYNNRWFFIGSTVAIWPKWLVMLYPTTQLIINSNAYSTSRIQRSMMLQQLPPILTSYHNAI